MRDNHTLSRKLAQYNLLAISLDMFCDLHNLVLDLCLSVRFS